MNVENMIYIYLFVCASMIVFNIVTAFVLKHRDQKTVKVSAKFYDKVQKQIEYMKQGTACDPSHIRYMRRKLKRVSNMVAFDQMLELFDEEQPQVIRQYLDELDHVFLTLCSYYCGKDKIEAAYFPYMIKKYHLITERSFAEMTEVLFALLDEPSIYCRENAMQALYTIGNSECIIKTLMKIDKSPLFFHGKLLSDGLLNFSGSSTELIDKIIQYFSCFSPEMKVNLLNYIRFSSGLYCEFQYSVLCDEKEDDEVRYCAIRYLGKYYYPNAYEILCSLSRNKQSDKWRYSAIASTALAIYPGQRTVALLKENLYSYNWYIRLNSADSLERLGVTYAELADVIDGEDRYASEILRYRLQRNN